MMNIQRRFRILVMGAAFGLALATGQGHGGVQAERALAAVRELIDSGQIAPETVLHLVVKQGNIASFLGRGQTLQKEWERTTGILIDPRVMPQEDALEFLASESQTDLTIARAHEYPDLVHEGLIADLTPLFERFGFVLSEGREDGYILAQNQATFAGRIVAVPADGDVTILYLRKDLIDDVENQKRFREKYGKALSVPATWSEYQELIEFFHRPEAGFYGALEQREPSTGWMFWLSRYASQAVPNQYLFDEQMRPLINSPRGIAATKSYLATLPFSPPEILDPGNGYTFTLPLFMQGKGFSTIITIAGAKLFNLETSKIRGKFIAVPMPGEEIDNRVIRRPAMIYGNNIVIPKDSNHQVLAFLYAMWLTDPDVYRKMVGVPGALPIPSG